MLVAVESLALCQTMSLSLATFKVKDSATTFTLKEEEECYGRQPDARFLFFEGCSGGTKWIGRWP